jgi:titin
MRAKILFAILFVAALCASCTPSPTFIVNSAGDESDVNKSDDICGTANGDCTLRAAIEQANATQSPIGLNISFENITLILIPSPLPELTAGGIRINGEGKVTLSGGQSGECIASEGWDGLVIQGSNSNSIKGLVLTGFDNAIVIETSSNPIASLNFIGGTGAGEHNVIGGNCRGIYVEGEGTYGNVVAGNYIGVNAAGTTANPNMVGILLANGTHENIIGTLSATILPGQPINLISGNEENGIVLSGSVGNRISGNYIGTSKSGSTALANFYSGIFLDSSTGNIIGVGPDGKGTGNLISSNVSSGIFLQNSVGNSIAGNLIGTSVNGLAALGNGAEGIRILGGSFNVIGANGDGMGEQEEGNLISGNGVQSSNVGVYIESQANVVAGNYIGTNITGAAALGNTNAGISISGSNNRVGTDSDGVADVDETNVISGNGNAGVYISGNFNTISGNRIGTDTTGAAPLGNGASGVILLGDENLIGIDGVALPHAIGRNIISSNEGANVTIYGNDNMVSGNYIGSNSTGNASLGVSDYGILLWDGADGNLVGTNGDGDADGSERNLISGNTFDGVRIANAYNNQIAGNYIGTNATATTALPNGSTGIYFFAAASGNVIGTNGDGAGDAAERNVISGNGSHGIDITDESTNNNIVAGNYIGVAIDGSSALGNMGIGVEILSGPDGTRIGTNADGISDALEANVISANGSAGIWILVANNTKIAGNYIGTDNNGTAPLGNNGDGIHIDGSDTPATNGNLVGGFANKGNVIAFNQQDGIEVSGSIVFPLNNPITYNSIFENEGIGINLVGPNSSSSVTLNDVGDADNGGNELHNFPELETAVANNNSIAVTGQIVDGLPNKSMLIQFFANEGCDPSNYGEGQTYIGQKTVSTNGSGDASFSVNFNQFGTLGMFITSTATTDKGTSEFSECIQAVAQISLEFPPLNIVPSSDVNCRTYCSAQADIADTLLDGVEYAPIGWDPQTGFFAFHGPTFGEVCFAPPVANGTPLMAISVNEQPLSADQITSEMIETLACPAIPAATPTVDVDEGENPTVGPIDSATATSTPFSRTAQCNDEIDNDRDGLVDLRDPECRDRFDDSE